MIKRKAFEEKERQTTVGITETAFLLLDQLSKALNMSKGGYIKSMLCGPMITNSINATSLIIRLDQCGEALGVAGGDIHFLTAVLQARTTQKAELPIAAQANLTTLITEFNVQQIILSDLLREVIHQSLRLKF